MLTTQDLCISSVSVWQHRTKDIPYPSMTMGQTTMGKRVLLVSDWQITYEMKNTEMSELTWNWLSAIDQNGCSKQLFNQQVKSYIYLLTIWFESSYPETYKNIYTHMYIYKYILICIFIIYYIFINVHMCVFVFIYIHNMIATQHAALKVI